MDANKDTLQSSDSDSSDSESGSDSDSSDSESEDSDESAKDSKKRKAEDEEESATPKKSKTEEPAGGASANLFVGNLSWNVDEAWLQQEFEGFGDLTGVRIMTERDTGRSRG